MGFRGRGRGRGRGGGSRGSERGSQDSESAGKKSFHAPRGSLWAVWVRGFPKNTTELELKQFLMKQIHGKVNIVSDNMNKMKTSYYMNFSSHEDAKPILALQGIKFKGQALSVGCQQPSSVSATLPETDMNELFQTIGSRYNPETKMLNLSSISKSKTFSFSNQEFCNSIWSIIGEGCPDVITIDFSSNRIRDLKSFEGLYPNALELKNLSFEKNEIQSLEQLNHLKGYRNTLEQVIISSNPIATLDPTAYSIFVRSRFRALKALDGAALPPLLQTRLSAGFRVPNLPHSKPSFFQNATCEQFAQQFVPKFFEWFDSPSRENALMGIYGDTAHFSLTMTSSADSTSPGKMGFAMKCSRNLHQSSDLNPKVHENLHKGRIGVMIAFRDFPRTSHQVESFSVDTVAAPSKEIPILSIVVNGQYMEEVPNTKEGFEIRNFNRVFIVTPAQNAIGASILNDHMLVYNAKRSNASIATTASSGVPDPSALISQLASYTQVSPEVAGRYLAQFQGNAEMAAHALFQAKASNSIL